MMTFSLAVINGTPRVDSRIVASQLGVEHKNTRDLVEKYVAKFQEFGQLPFETEVVNGHQGGGNPQKFYLLNEDQAIFLLTLTRNTDQAVALKIRLVQAFGEQRRALEAAKAPKPVPALPTASCLPFPHTWKDLRMDESKFLSVEQWDQLYEPFRAIPLCCKFSQWAEDSLNERIKFLTGKYNINHINTDDFAVLKKEFNELLSMAKDHYNRIAKMEEDFILANLRPPINFDVRRHTPLAYKPRELDKPVYPMTK